MPSTDSSLHSVMPNATSAIAEINFHLAPTLSSGSFNNQSNSAGWQCKSFRYLNHEPELSPDQAILAQIKSWADHSEVFHNLVSKGSNLAPLMQATQQRMERAEGILDVYRFDALDAISNTNDSLKSSVARLRSQTVRGVQGLIESHPGAMENVSKVQKQVGSTTNEISGRIGDQAKRLVAQAWQLGQQGYDSTERLIWATPKFARNIKELVSEVALQGKEIAALTLESSKQHLSNAVHPLSNVRATQSNQVLIGIADTGFDQDNPYIDRHHIQLGGDFVDNDANPLIREGDGSDQHGTETLGIIQSLSPQANLFVSRVSDAQDIAFSIRQFVEKKQELGNRVAVFNLSSELVQTSSDGTITLRDKLTAQEFDAIAEAQKHGVLIAVAAGNDNGALSPWKEAAKFFDNLVIIGAADGVARANYSNAGANLLAPGGTTENPILTTRGNGIASVAGTSAATAVVSSAIANIWSANSDLNYRQIKDILQRTATDVGPVGFDMESGAGILDLNSAIELAKVTRPEDLVPLIRPTGSITFWQNNEGVRAGLRPADWWSDASSALTNAKNTVETAAQDAGNGINQAATNVVSATKEVAYKVDDAVKTAVHDAGNGINQAATNVVSATKEAAHKVNNAVKTAVHDAGNGINQAATNVVSATKEVAHKVEQASTDLAQNLNMSVGGNKAINIGNQFSQGWNNFSHSTSEKGQWLIEQYNQGQKLQAESWKKMQSDLHMPDWVSDALMGTPDWENSGPRHWLQEKGKEFDSWWDETKPSWGADGDVDDVVIGAGKALWDMVDGSVVLVEHGKKLTNPIYRTTHPEETERNQKALLDTFIGAHKIKTDIDSFPTLVALDMIYGTDSTHKQVSSWVQRQESRGSKVFNALAEPYTDAWNNGHPGQAIGRGIVDVGSLFIGEGEIEAVGKAGEFSEVAGKSGKVAEAAGGIEKSGKVAETAGGIEKSGRVAETAEVAKQGLASDIGETVNSITSQEKFNLENVMQSAKDSAKHKNVERAAQGRAFDKFIQEKLSLEFDQGIKNGQDLVFYKREFFHYPGKNFRADHAAMIENEAGKEGMSIIENKLTGSQVSDKKVLEQAKNYGNVMGRNILEGRPAKLKYIFAESSTEPERAMLRDAINKGIQDGMKEQQSFLKQHGEFHEIPENVDFQVDIVDYGLNLQD